MGAAQRTTEAPILLQNLGLVSGPDGAQGYERAGDLVTATAAGSTRMGEIARAMPTSGADGTRGCNGNGSAGDERNLRGHLRGAILWTAWGCADGVIDGNAVRQIRTNVRSVTEDRM